MPFKHPSLRCEEDQEDRYSNFGGTLVLGKRLSGKTHYLLHRWLPWMRQRRYYHSCHYVSQIKSTLEEYQSSYQEPNAYFYDQVTPALEKALFADDQPKLLVLDGVYQLERHSLIKSSFFQQLVFNSRHDRIQWAITHQWVMSMPPDLRANLEDVILMEGEEVNTWKKFYDCYVPSTISSYRFVQMMLSATQNQRYLHLSCQQYRRYQTRNELFYSGNLGEDLLSTEDLLQQEGKTLVDDLLQQQQEMLVLPEQLEKEQRLTEEEAQRWSDENCLRVLNEWPCLYFGDENDLELELRKSLSYEGEFRDG